MRRPCVGWMPPAGRRPARRAVQALDDRVDGTRHMPLSSPASPRPAVDVLCSDTVDGMQRDDVPCRNRERRGAKPRIRVAKEMSVLTIVAYTAIPIRRTICVKNERTSAVLCPSLLTSRAPWIVAVSGYWIGRRMSMRTIDFHTKTNERRVA